MKKIFLFLKKKWVLGTLGGAGAAGYFGKSIGTAGYGAAINSMIPYAIVGGLITFLVIKCFKFLKKNKEKSKKLNEKDAKINKLEKDLEESENMKKKIVDYYEGPKDKNKRSFIKLPVIGALSAFFGRFFRR